MKKKILSFVRDVVYKMLVTVVSQIALAVIVSLLTIYAC